MTQPTKPLLAFFVPSLKGGGAERVVVNLAAVFAEWGYPVDVVVCQGEGVLREAIPARVRVVNLNASGVLTAIPFLAGYLRRARPAALLSVMDHANVAAVLARMLGGVRTRLVVSAHVALRTSGLAEPGWKVRLLQRLLSHTYRRADGIVAVSAGVAEELSALTSIPVTAMAVIHNPIVTPALLRASECPVNHPWFERSEVPVILSVGRLEPQKDMPTLVEAFALLRRDRNARLAILGTGSQEPQLRDFVARLGLDEDVWFGGFQANPFPYMRRASLLVLSSIYEGFGNVLVEGMACGTPVVSTRAPSGPSEILADGRFGRLVPCRAPVELAGAMAATLDTPADREALVRRASEFSAEAAGRRYLSLLQPQADQV